MENAIIVGAGYAGSVCARILAENGYRVTVLEKRPNIAGNMFDEYDANGILVHKYGPHISVMNEDKCFDFLSRFTEWVPYHHSVNALIDGVQVPLPFNFTAIDLLFAPKKAIELKDALIADYGFGSNVPILELKKSTRSEIKELAEYIFEKVFLHYTVKMWGVSPEEIDPAVTGRIPVRLSYDNRHFLHKYQVMPQDGFTKIFERMLAHPNITVQLNTNATDCLRVDEHAARVLFHNQDFPGPVIYTGALDEWFAYRLGVLPYRSLEFEVQTWPQEHVQDCTVLNWPDERPQTRRTEMKRLTGQKTPSHVTTTLTETPGPYDRDAARFNVPYYPIIKADCIQMYENYKALVKSIPNIYLAGRLAEFKYYNMESTIMQAFLVAEQITGKEIESC